MSSNYVTSTRGSHSDGSDVHDTNGESATIVNNKAFVFDHWCTTSAGDTFDAVTTNYKKL
jgi:hypothetical protein